MSDLVGNLEDRFSLDAASVTLVRLVLGVHVPDLHVGIVHARLDDLHVPTALTREAQRA